MFLVQISVQTGAVLTEVFVIFLSPGIGIVPQISTTVVKILALEAWLCGEAADFHNVPAASDANCFCLLFNPSISLSVVYLITVSSRLSMKW
jgi:hypothetical protein